MQRLLVLCGVPVAAAVIALSCSATPGASTFGNGGGGSTAASPSTMSGMGGNPLGDLDSGPQKDQCVGLQCQAQTDDCAGKGKPPTTVAGVVYDPAGSLPLYNVYVYIPTTTPDAIQSGNPICTQCEAPASGSPVIGTSTDAVGNFRLSQGPADKWGVPSGDNIPLVLQVGKWRRQVVVPHITACTANVLPDPPTPSQKLRLPAKSSEGDMPLMAFTSGCDPAECFLRHIGIDDSEFVPPGSPTGHIHFYTGRDSTGGGDASKVAGGNSSSDTYQWWASATNLLKYDIVFNACECNPYDRGAGAYAAMHDYLSGGGRVFTTHYFYNWFGPSTGPSDFQSVVNWALPENPFDVKPYSDFFIDTTFPKGKAFADWLQGNAITQAYGKINLVDTRHDMNTVTPAASRWIYSANASSDAQYAAMYMSFNTPVAKPVTEQCGRAVFSDVHLSGSSDDSTFPQECANADTSHSVNEKALEFLFFDLSSCVQDNSKPPPPPTPK